MYKVIIDKKELTAQKGELLGDFLIKNGFDTPHPCGGVGKCKKCAVRVNGEAVLSCQYKIEHDATVELGGEQRIYSEIGEESSEWSAENCCFVLDLGTTTLALALVSLNEKKVLRAITDTNPQRAFGADVISRIDYSVKNGTELMQSAVASRIGEMIKKLGDVGDARTLYVSGNTVMLHILLGISPDSMGRAPYTPAFLGSKTVSGASIGIVGVDEVITLPSISAFVGADLVAGLNVIPKPTSGKYNLLVDLGTNAEIILQGDDKISATAAAAGPCFEGASISCGMSATAGAIYEYSLYGTVKTIENAKPVGVCGTGLGDVIAVLLQKGIIDETGLLEEDFEIAQGVYITQDDVRQYQLAKSAICSGILSLMERAEVAFENIDTLYISGGFSSKINVENAALTGLLPSELKFKCKSIGNSSLSGAVKYAIQKNDLSYYAKKAEYVDLSSSLCFSTLFVENMMFGEV